MRLPVKRFGALTGCGRTPMPMPLPVMVLPSTTLPLPVMLRPSELPVKVFAAM
ncbi:hypothetical protein D3C71_1956980 [compost metagenome]